MKLPSWRVLGLAAVVTSSIAACGSDDQKYLESGKAFLEKKEDASALIQFKNAISQNPENAAARFLFARTLRRMGDLPAAETEFRKALSLGHERGPVVLELAPTLLDMGQAGKALDELGNVPSPDPAGRAELAALRGDALLMQGDVAGARLAYDEALSLSAGHPRALVGQARIEMAGGNRAAGLAALDRVEKEHPDFAPAWNIRAAVALQDGKIDDAVKAYDRAIALQPADARAYVGIVPALLSLKRIDDASGRVAMLVKVAPGTPATKYLQALIDYTKGDRIGARGHIQQTLKAAPEDARALLLAGSIELDLGNYATAEKHLGRVVAAAPKEARPRHLLATTYLRMGQPEKARATLAPIAGDGSADARTLALQGEIAGALKDPKALEYLERAVKLQPDDVELRTRLGAARLASGRTAEGVADLQAAAAGSSKSAADLILIEHHLRQKQLPEARAAAQALLRKLPDDPATHHALGLVLLAEGDRPGARASFEKAAQLSPVFLPAARALADLDLADGKTDAALGRYRSVLAKDPTQREAPVLLAALLQRTRAPTADILAVLDKSIAANPTAIEPRLVKVEYLLSAGDAKAALEAARNAESLAADDVKVLFALARAQHVAGEYSQAAATYGKLTTQMPKSPVPYAGQAEAYVAAKNWPAARIALERAAALRPDHVPTYLAQVELGIRAGELDRAQRDAQAIQKRWPKQGDGFLAEAQVLIARKDLPGAEKILREGLARSGSTDVQNRLFALLLSSDRAPEAEKLADAWMAGHAADVRAAIFAGDAYIARGKFADAERWFQRVLRLRPDDTVALNNLAWVMGRLGKADAVAVGQRALAKAPDNPALLDTVGTLQVQFGPVEDGVANLRKALAGLPKSAAVRLNLARGLIKAGKNDEAATQLDEAGKLPMSDPQKQDLASLRKAL